MPTDNSQNSFRRGVMSLVILSLLEREDMYGYQLVQETERRSGGRITNQEGSLYPVLYKGRVSDPPAMVELRNHEFQSVCLPVVVVEHQWVPLFFCENIRYSEY